jgi:nicotinamidase-related amidase
VEAHRAGLDRIVQAGAKPISWIQLACELQRDWARKDTAQHFAEIVFASIHP